MVANQSSQQAAALLRRYDYDGRTVIVADFGPAADPVVDVLDGTALVVFSDGSQHEIELPSGNVEAFNRNGIVTFEVRG